MSQIWLSPNTTVRPQHSQTEHLLKAVSKKMREEALQRGMDAGVGGVGVRENTFLRPVCPRTSHLEYRSLPSSVRVIR